MHSDTFKDAILQGLPDSLPPKPLYYTSINHAPNRKDILSVPEKKLAIRNALRYFPPSFHTVLATEFLNELREYGHIYMYRFKPDYKIYARNIDSYNGGFGMVLDGSEEAGRKLRMMLHWDVNNGISRRSWARNEGAISAIKREMAKTPKLKVTLPYVADEWLIDEIFDN